MNVFAAAAYRVVTKKSWNAKQEMWYSVVAKAFTIVKPLICHLRVRVTLGHPLNLYDNFLICSMKGLTTSVFLQVWSKNHPHLPGRFVTLADSWAPAQTRRSRVLVLASRHLYFSHINLDSDSDRSRWLWFKLHSIKPVLGHF